MYICSSPAPNNVSLLFVGSIRSCGAICGGGSRVDDPLIEDACKCGIHRYRSYFMRVAVGTYLCNIGVHGIVGTVVNGNNIVVGMVYPLNVTKTLYIMILIGILENFHFRIDTCIV